jgi:uncharacterized membrane protein YvbJ
MKKCKFCAEDIQDAAIKCKHCGADVAGGMFKSDAKDVAQGIKKVELDENVYKIAVFFSMIVAAVIGWMAATLSGNAWAGWGAGTVLFFILGGAAYRKFLTK